jgi:hypothetical protein
MAIATPPRVDSPPPQPRAFVAARRIYGGFFVAMAAVNVVMASADLSLYATFGADPLVGFYGDLWRGLVTTNLELLVPALIAFELAAGLVMWWGRDRALRLALWAVVVFQLALVPASIYAAVNLALVLVPLGLLWWHHTLQRR